MDNKIETRPHAGKTIILDSDYRGGALFFSFITSVLLAFAIGNSFFYEKIRKTPSQAISWSEATAMFSISIILSVFAGAAFIYSLVKLILSKEQRDAVYREVVNFAQKPAGVYVPNKKIENVGEYYIDTGEKPVPKDPVQVKKRDWFADEVFNEPIRRNKLDTGMNY